MADADGRRLNGGRGLGAALAADFDPWAAVGGVRGLVETTVPGIIFLVVYTAKWDAREAGAQGTALLAEVERAEDRHRHLQRQVYIVLSEVVFLDIEF